MYKLDQCKALKKLTLSFAVRNAPLHFKGGVAALADGVGALGIAVASPKVVMKRALLYFIDTTGI